MHRIDGPGAVNNLFTEGDPAVPQMATVVTAMWLNDTQENLCRALEAAGITPVKGDYDQLRQTILKLSGSGLVGEIKMWGSETLPASGDYMEADGPALLIADYPELYAVWGNAWGSAPTGHFRGPDLRGDFVRFWSHGSGRDPDAAARTGGDHVASRQAHDTVRHIHPMGWQLAGLGSSGAVGIHIGTRGSLPIAWTHDCDMTQLTNDELLAGTSFSGVGNSGRAPTGTETRPANVALMPIFRWR